MIRSVKTRSIPSLPKALDRFLPICAGYDPVTSRFEKDFADRERLLIVVDTQDRSLWLHDWGATRMLELKPGLQSEMFRYRLFDQRIQSDTNPTKKDAFRKVARMPMAHKCGCKLTRTRER
jgi:hypothetical protein